MGNERKLDKVISFEECLRRVLISEYECRHMPEDEVEAGEVVLGTLENHVARSMYSLWREMHDGAQKFVANIPDDLSPFDQKRKDEVLRLKCQLHQYQNRINCAKGIFWELVYTDFPKARHPGVSVGVRKDWVVVIFKSSRASIIDLLSGGVEPFGSE